MLEMKSTVHLNLGCGPLCKDGEIGVDKYPTDAADVQADVLALPFADGCAEFIRCDHVLEHQEARKAVPLLLEAYRVLAPGGTIRVGVPDFEASCMEYIKQHSLYDKALMQRWWFGSQSHDGEYHLSGWDKDTLSDLLHSVGFAEVMVDDDRERDEGVCIVAIGRKVECDFC